MLCAFHPLNPLRAGIAVAPPSGGLPDHSWILNLDATTGVFSDAGSTPGADTDPVQEWHDQSTSGNDATGVTTTRPLLDTAGIDSGLPGVDFDGSDDYLDLGTSIDWSTNTAWAFFAVAKYDLASNYSPILDDQGGNMNSAPATLRDNGRWYVCPPGVGTRYSWILGTAAGVYLVTAYGASGAAPNLRLNGSDQGSAAATEARTPAKIDRVGAAQIQRGSVIIGQVLLTKQPLTLSEIEAVESYLASKWSIAL